MVYVGHRRIKSPVTGLAHLSTFIKSKPAIRNGKYEITLLHRASLGLTFALIL